MEFLGDSVKLNSRRTKDVEGRTVLSGLVEKPMSAHVLSMMLRL